MMKNFETNPESLITLTTDNDATTYRLYTDDGFNLLSNLWIKAATERRLMYEASFLDRKIIQFPTDIVAIQELIWKLKPEFIVETGVAHGGSLILSASMLELIGNGTVIGIDIDIKPHNREAIQNHKLAHRVRLIQGSSISPETFAEVRSLVVDGTVVLVILDSNHSETHVLNELLLYSSLVTPNSYIVVHDGAQAWVWDIPSGRPEWRHSHPLGAIEKFLHSNSGFSVDHHWTRWNITSSPSGFLQRIVGS
jgi:cephalosporin hydroxylase